jgi:transcriptional regulator with XRE-family HTH domain
MGANVRDAVARRRRALNLGYAELSRRLADGGRDIPPLGLRRIESGDRRVDVDDLTALAVALKVSPVTLLMPGMPGATDGAEMVAVSGAESKVSASLLWLWLRASNGGAALVGLLPTAFLTDAEPVWRHPRWTKEPDDGDD